MTGGQLTKQSFMGLDYECLYLHIRDPMHPKCNIFQILLRSLCVEKRKAVYTETFPNSFTSLGYRSPVKS